VRKGLIGKIGENMAVRRFPANLFAGLFGFDPKKNYFEAEEGAEKAPTVAF
ncbi:MAG TPA: LemA family protein, partial [Kiritimatiellia bacterium]|nr:LemA family protein [Kiritimatiellia bacterium]